MEHELQARKSQVQAIVHDQGRKGGTEMNQERDTTPTTVRRDGRNPDEKPKLGFSQIVSLGFAVVSSACFGATYFVNCNCLPRAIFFCVMAVLSWVVGQNIQRGGR